MIDEILFEQLPYIDPTIRDTVIKRYLDDNPNHMLQVATTTGGSGTAHSVASIVYKYGRQHSAIVECRANEREDALNILAFQLAASQLPVVELAYIFRWMQDNPHAQVALWATYPTELTKWGASIENFVTDDVIDSSQELDISSAIEDLAAELLVYQQEPAQTESEDSHDA